MPLRRQELFVDRNTTQQTLGFEFWQFEQQRAAIKAKCEQDLERLERSFVKDIHSGLGRPGQPLSIIYDVAGNVIGFEYEE